MAEVTIKSYGTENDYDEHREVTIVEVDGKEIGSGRYGGEPEDNVRYRDYAWVEGLLFKLAESLGAKATIDAK